MTGAIFGLLGVVVGGVLTGLIGFLAERGREKRAARTSARIVREHLLDIALAGEDAFAGRTPAPITTADALATVWRDERHTLAMAMDYAPYAQAAAAVRAGGKLAARLDSPGDAERQLVDDVAAGLQALLEVARD